MTYEIMDITQMDGTEVQILKRENEDGTISWIPMDEANSDYQSYLNPDANKNNPVGGN